MPAAYKKVPRVELTVSRPRTAKKSTSAFIAAVRKVREADTTLEAGAEHTLAVTTAVSDFLTVIAALNSRRRFLDTLERDELIDATALLTASLSPDAQRALEPVIEAALDD